MKTLAEFRVLTANLPGDAPILSHAPDHSYRHLWIETTTAVAHICASPTYFEPDIGDDPALYGHGTIEAIRRNRRTVVLIT